MPDVLVIDSNGVVQAPRNAYVVLQEALNMVRSGWATLEDLKQSLQSAPPARGMPEGAPSPHQLFDYQGQMVRHVIDSNEQRVPYINEAGQVVEDIKFRRVAVSLTLEGARKATDSGAETDFWNGFTWLRGGYSPERDFPSMVKAMELAAEGAALTFTQALPDTDVAVVRHQMQRIDQQRPPLTVQTTQKPRQGRPKLPHETDQTAAPETSGAAPEE